MVINISKNYKCHVVMTKIYTAEEDMLLSKWYKQIRHGFGEWPCGCAGMVVTGWVRIYQRADSSVGRAMGL